MKIVTSLAILLCAMFFGSVLAFDDPDLIFYFPFEKFDKGVALDRSGKAHNGTIKGDIRIVDEGKQNEAATWGGIKEHALRKTV